MSVVSKFVNQNFRFLEMLQCKVGAYALLYFYCLIIQSRCVFSLFLYTVSQCVPNSSLMFLTRVQPWCSILYLQLMLQLHTQYYNSQVFRLYVQCKYCKFLTNKLFVCCFYINLLRCSVPPYTYINLINKYIYL